MDELNDDLVEYKGRRRSGKKNSPPPLKGFDARKKEKGRVRLLAALLGLDKKEAGGVIHQAKQEGGLGGQDNLQVGEDGSISHKGEDLTGNW